MNAPRAGGPGDMWRAIAELSHSAADLFEASGELRRELEQLRSDHAAMAREVDGLSDALKAVRGLLDDAEPRSEALGLARRLNALLEAR